MTLHRRAPRGALGLTTVLALGAAMALALVLPVAASAAGGGATIVRGTQLAADTCEAGGYAMTGSLDGCWWILTFDSKTDPGGRVASMAGGSDVDGLAERDVAGLNVRTQITTEKLDRLASHVEAGTLRRPTITVMPLDQAGRALADCANRHVRGKLVLTP
jgi:NADPH:quinone reductase-like Zn-dependent oxidoreductase